MQTTQLINRKLVKNNLAQLSLLNELNTLQSVAVDLDAEFQLLCQEFGDILSPQIAEQLHEKLSKVGTTATAATVLALALYMQSPELNNHQALNGGGKALNGGDSKIERVDSIPFNSDSMGFNAHSTVIQRHSKSDSIPVQLNENPIQRHSIEFNSIQSGSTPFNSVQRDSTKGQSDSTGFSQKVTALRRAIIGQESAHNHKAINPHSGALGYGQVMPFNLNGNGKGWDYQVLGRDITTQEFLNSRELQIQIIDGKLTEYWRSQAVEGRSEEEIVRRVASIWYSGKSKLWNSTKPQFYNGHSYPSISEYTASVYQKYLKESPTLPSAAVGNTALRVAAQARSWKGRHFKPGQTARCADFVRAVLREVGIEVPVSDNPVDKQQQWNGAHPLRAQSFFGEDVGQLIYKVEDLKPGDLVAFSNTYGNWEKGAITHVGIYVGNGMMVDRPTANRPVQYRSIRTFTFRAGVRPHAYR